jgi:hypothetical protein
VQAACGIDQHYVAAARLGGGHRVEDHRGRIGSFLRADDIDPGPVGPDLQLIDRGGAERVGGADQRLLALFAHLIGEFSDRRRLANTVHTDHEYHSWAEVRLRSLIPGCFGGSFRFLEHTKHFLLHQFAQTLTAALAFAHGRDDFRRRRDADVSHQENLFEIVRRIDVDLTCLRFGGRGETDHLIEAIETILELLRGLLQPLL